MAMQSELHNLQGQRLHQSIVQRFHALIQEGSLEHGARLPAERVLAEQLKVSRSSVREAIRTLELQGLVVSKHGSGTFINTRSLNAVTTLMTSNLGEGLGAGETQLREIFEVRHLLAPQLAALAALRATPEDVERLAAILEERAAAVPGPVPAATGQARTVPCLPSPDPRDGPVRRSSGRSRGHGTPSDCGGALCGLHQRGL